MNLTLTVISTRIASAPETSPSGYQGKPRGRACQPFHPRGINRCKEQSIFMSPKKLAAFAGALATAVAMITGSAAHAATSSANDEAPPPEVVEIIKRTDQTRVLSDEDRTTLLDQYPEWTTRVVDPGRTEERHETVTSPVGFAATAIRCQYHDRYINYYDGTGRKLFEWHHRLNICPVSGAPNKVRRVSRSQILNRLNNNEFYLRSPELDQEVGNGTQWYSSEYIGAVDQCLPAVGCIATFRPRSKFVVNGGTGKVDYYWNRL
jgi:hypothetical protein